MSVKDSTKLALLAALKRLRDGKGKHTNGKLTIVNLATEAGVGRASVYRCEDIIAEFNRLPTGNNRLRNTKEAQRENHTPSPKPNQTSREKELRQAVKQMANRITLLVGILNERNAEIAILKEQLMKASPTVAQFSLGRGPQNAL